MLFGPFPGVLEELLTSKVALLDALLCKLVDHFCLCSDRSVVGAWHPASILSVKTSLAHKNVLDGVVEHVTHVEHACHIWWRDYYSVWFTSIWFTAEQFVVHPVLIPFCFHVLWSVFTC